MIDQNQSTQVIELAGGGSSSSTFKNFSKARFIDFEDNVTVLTPSQISDGVTLTISATETEYDAMDSIPSHYTAGVFEITSLFGSLIMYNDDSVADNTDFFTASQGLVNIRMGMTYTDNASNNRPIGSQTTRLNVTKDVTTLTTLQDMIDLDTTEIDEYSDKSTALEWNRLQGSGMGEASLKLDKSGIVSLPPKNILFTQFNNASLDLSAFAFVMYIGTMGSDFTNGDNEMRIHINQKNQPSKGRFGYYSDRVYKLNGSA